jgi:hypothetical protein
MSEIRALFAAEVSMHQYTFACNIKESFVFASHCLACWQLLLRSETRCYSQGTIIADSREEARGLMVITSGQVRTTLKLMK